MRYFPAYPETQPSPQPIPIASTYEDIDYDVEDGWAPEEEEECPPLSMELWSWEWLLGTKKEQECDILDLVKVANEWVDEKQTRFSKFGRFTEEDLKIRDFEL